MVLTEKNLREDEKKSFHSKMMGYNDARLTAIVQT